MSIAVSYNFPQDRCYSAREERDWNPKSRARDNAHDCHGGVVCAGWVETKSEKRKEKRDEEMMLNFAHHNSRYLSSPMSRINFNFFFSSSWKKSTHIKKKRKISWWNISIWNAITSARAVERCLILDSPFSSLNPSEFFLCCYQKFNVKFQFHFHFMVDGWMGNDFSFFISFSLSLVWLHARFNSVLCCAFISTRMRR